MSPITPPSGSWYEQAEQAVKNLEAAHMEGATVEPAGIALAFLRGSLAIAEALGGVDNELAPIRKIEAQLNLIGGGLTESLATLTGEVERIARTLDALESRRS